MASSDEQLVRNQLLLREVNERIAEVAHRDGSSELSGHEQMFAYPCT